VNVAEDTEAIRQCQQGDMNGLAHLVRRYQVPAGRLAYLLTGDRVLAEDIVQDSFLQAYRKIHKLRADHSFAPWFYRIITNLARERQRRSMNRGEISLHDLLERDELAELSGQHMPDPADDLERQEKRTLLFQALATLTQKQREAVVLKYYLGFRDTEIAHILDCHETAARQRLHAGLKALEKAIRRHYPALLPDHLTETTFFMQGELRHEPA
jgi:RNA polymerase sigma factor (sigma-70 family)